MKAKIQPVGKRPLIIALALIVLLAGVAASLVAQRDESIDPRLVAAAEGPSGLKWIGGDRESPFMHPGMDCIACHSRGEGPRFQVAGTIYTRLDEKDDWLGVAGVTVELTDSTGKLATLLSNKAGNFFSGRSTSLTPPLSVKLTRGSAIRVMGSKAPVGDCASCHTAKGANGAPGRVMAP